MVDRFDSIRSTKTNASNSPFLIAEVGTSHQGSIIKAKELIDASKEAKVNTVKFQIVFAEEIVHQKVGKIKLPSGKLDIYKEFKKIEQDLDFYLEIVEYCKKKEIEFSASIFGEKSLKLYQQLNPKFVKLASPELNHYPLIQSIKKTNLPIIASTGVSKWKDIKEALTLLPKSTALLHCITTYPTEERSYNLKWVKQIIKLTHAVCGISDHTKDPLVAPLTALRWGASIFEKHITLDKKNTGLDDSFALSPAEFLHLSNSLKDLAGQPFLEIEKQLIELFGEKRYTKISGKPKRILSMHEKKIYKTTNRSWVALKDLEKGKIIIEKDAALLRCEQNAPSGLSPKFNNYKGIFGYKLKRSVQAGKGITASDILYKI